MKAEHRKELQTNSLVHFLDTAVKHAKEGPSQKTLLYSGLALLVVALIGIFVYISTHSKDSDAVRWEQWFVNTVAPKPDVKPDDMRKLDEEYPGTSETQRERIFGLRKFVAANPGTSQARLARFQEARLLLPMAVDLGALSKTNRDNAKTCITKARDLYEKLSDESGDVPYLAQEALFNGGKTSEDLGDYEKAKKLYGRLKKDYPKGLYIEETEKALTRLSNEKELETLKKLASAN